MNLLSFNKKYAKMTGDEISKSSELSWYEINDLFEQFMKRIPLKTKDRFEIDQEISRILKLQLTLDKDNQLERRYWEGYLQALGHFISKERGINNGKNQEKRQSKGTPNGKDIPKLGL